MELSKEFLENVLPPAKRPRLCLSLKHGRVQGEESRFASPTKEASYEKAAEGVIPANTKASTKWAAYIIILLCPVIVMTVLLYLRNCYHSTVLLSDDDIALSHTKVVLYSQYRNSGVFDAPTQNAIILYICA